MLTQRVNAAVKVTVHLLLDKRDKTLCEGYDPAIHVVVRLLNAGLIIYKLRLLLLSQNSHHRITLPTYNNARLTASFRGQPV